ncbi:TetR/AcrR family transcriptional regulator [Kribbella solani]|uniref:AcrR family transcriptional regulator n=1 Tax=Kribbella solani TaxID=236067 RepID=A0A841DLE8_9ACTN|nr:TetR/AcrR family transcriptional regulator [Kribbella solani]MBB5979473.1 AcrR family transcriptional regulator [Kribbella solani]MDX2972225.1 TetR/AcrR family transcriptional regulator [Kribbella solani]MDX3003185.1 TetR/AcrR family transcriptional regulator [Kribbella solani]
MPRQRTGDTRARIQQAALDLFAERGVRQTSLRDIAERLGVTKPALYYHFASREDLLNSLVEPMVKDFEAYAAELRAAAPIQPKELLGSYFDLGYRHRTVIRLAIRDLSVLQELNLADRFIEWRGALGELLVGSNPSLSDVVRCMVALGGLSDCAVMIDHEPVSELRAAAVEAAYDSLGRP